MDGRMYEPPCCASSPPPAQEPPGCALALPPVSHHSRHGSAGTPRGSESSPKTQSHFPKPGAATGLGRGRWVTHITPPGWRALVWYYSLLKSTGSLRRGCYRQQYTIAALSPAVQMTEGKPFLATSIYQDDIVKGVETTRAQLDRTQGLNCMLSGYEAARQQQQQRTQSAPALAAASGPLRPLGGTQRPPIAMTSVGEAVGYQTTYKSQVIDSPLTGGPAAAGFKKTLSGTAGTASAAAGTTSEPMRYQTMPRAMPPGMFSDVPSYRIDYGADGSDPLDRSAPGERFQSRLSTTRDLAEGTVRNTNNPPGYTGHTPASRHHELARAHADAADERMDGKVDMMLYSLDQFSRSRVPLYTGYKPQAPGNITLIQPAQGPTKATTYGAASYQATKNGMPPLDNTHYNNRWGGLLGRGRPEVDGPPRSSSLNPVPV